MTSQKKMYDVCVYGYVFPEFMARDEHEAVEMGLFEYHKITGLVAHADDEAVVWKVSREYPYQWRGLNCEILP